MKRAAVFLNGAIRNDSRVLKTIASLSKEYEVNVFYVNGNDADNQLFENAANINLYSVSYKNISHIQKIKRHTLFYKEFDFLYKLASLEKDKYDLVWANDLPTCRPALKLAKKFQAQFIYDSHEIYLETINQFFLEQPNKIKNQLFKFLILFMKTAGFYFEKKIMRKVDLLITVNESLQNYFVEKYKIPINKTAFIMNCPNFKKSAVNFNSNSRLQFPEGSNVIIYQGVLNEGRGLLVFLEVMKLLPKNFIWIILGEGILRQKMEQFVVKHQLSATVKFLGKVEEKELESYTKQAHIGLNLLEPKNLSKALASPNKLFQYIHSGIPSISSETVENRKVISQFKVGLLTSNKIEDLKENVIKLTQYSLDIHEFQKAKELFSWENQEYILLQKLHNLKNN